MRSKNEKVAAFACVALLDRGWGKPAMALTGPDGAPLIAQQVLVNLVAGGPINDAERARQAYQFIMGNPGVDTSGIVFEQAPRQAIEEPQQQPLEVTQEPAEADEPPAYRLAVDPALEPYSEPSNVTNLADWERLGR